MKDQGKLGAPVQALCQGLPAYWAQEQIGEMFFIDAGSCLRVDLLILDVSLCGHVDMGPDMGPDIAPGIAPLPLI
ncbi:UNVERIFIED_CONTAM: hypothetical protein FKN15_059335 [Acipenser sinensis]